MDHVEPEELDVYRPQPSVFIGRPIVADANYGLFSIKNDKVSTLLTNDDGYDVDVNVPNLLVHRSWTEKNREHAMMEFGVTEWEPDLTF